jgi:hypothetical protein
MTRPNPDIALIYHYDLARALADEVVDWQAIPVNVQAGREGGDLCRAAADFAKRRDLFAMPAPHAETPAEVSRLRAVGQAEDETSGAARPEAVEDDTRTSDLASSADFAKRRDLFAMPAPNKENHERNAVSGMEAGHGNGTTTAQAQEAKEAKDRGKSAPVTPTTVTNDEIAAPVGPNPTVEQWTADPEPSTASTAVPGRAAEVEAVRPGNSEASEGGLPHHRDQLIARIKDLIAEHPEAEPLLRRYWPEGVSTLKHDGHSDAQLQLILAAVRRVEAEVGAGWHPDDGPPPHTADPEYEAEMQHQSATVDEGGRVDQEEVDALAFMFNALDPDSQELCMQIAREAHAVIRPISVSANPTVRRWSIARAVIAWAATGRSVDELWFVASNLATFEQCRDPSATLGGLISQFTIEQADGLYEAAGQ